nr:hypothetical protein [Tanacetum cinerariifolium]
MKLSEVKKFSDGTLIKIHENLVDMVKKNKLGTGNKRLKGRDWTNMDVEKSNEMVDKIEKTLKRREQLKRLEEGWKFKDYVNLGLVNFKACTGYLEFSKTKKSSMNTSTDSSIKSWKIANMHL